MPNPRREILTTGETYHLLNRSIAETDIFIGKKNPKKLISLINYYRFTQKIKYSKYKLLSNEDRVDYYNNYIKSQPLVEIYTYAIMPTHFHILCKQLQDDGLKTFAANIQNSFAKYFNKRNNRSGGLFQKPFKAKRIENDAIFLHVSRYIHLNPITSFLIQFQELYSYPWTSYQFYLGNNNSDFINTSRILEITGSKEKYNKFVSDQIEYQRDLDLIKRLLLE